MCLLSLHNCNDVCLNVFEDSGVGMYPSVSKGGGWECVSGV